MINSSCSTKQQYKMHDRQDQTYPFYKFQYHQTLLYHLTTYNHKPGWSPYLRRHRATPYNLRILHVRRSNTIVSGSKSIVHISMCNTWCGSFVPFSAVNRDSHPVFVDIVPIRITMNLTLDVDI